MTAEKVTVRQLEDYYTLLNDDKKKILNLKCKFKNKDYVLGIINTSKINASCAICGKTEYKDILPVLINSDKVVKKNCYNDELINCLNKDDIADCKSNSLKLCDKNKIQSENLEFVMSNIQERGIDSSGNVKEQIFRLIIKDPKETTKSISLSSVVVEGTDTKTKAKQEVLLYYVCCNKNIGVLEDVDKIYLEQFTEKKDKIRFKIYFMVPEVKGGELIKKYLGITDGDLCGNIKLYKDDIKFLNLYSKQDDKNILVFEPELIRFE